MALSSGNTNAQCRGPGNLQLIRSVSVVGDQTSADNMQGERRHNPGKRRGDKGRAGLLSGARTTPPRDFEIRNYDDEPPRNRIMAVGKKIRGWSVMALKDLAKLFHYKKETKSSMVAEEAHAEREKARAVTIEEIRKFKEQIQRLNALFDNLIKARK